MAVATDSGWANAHASFASAPAVALIAAGFVIGPGEIAWVGIGSLVAVLLASARRQSSPRDADPLRALRVELARCRRNGTEADLLVARLPRRLDGRSPDLACALRVTDGLALRESRRGQEMLALFDARDAARIPVERRLRGLESDALDCAWARFPDDGVTLEALLDRVGERARSPRGHSLPSAGIATRGGVPARPIPGWTADPSVAFASERERSG